LGQQVFSDEAGGVVVAAGERGDENGVAAGGPDGEGEVMDVSGEFLYRDDVFIVVAELGLWLAFPRAIEDLRLGIEWVGKGRESYGDGHVRGIARLAIAGYGFQYVGPFPVLNEGDGRCAVAAEVCALSAVVQGAEKAIAPAAAAAVLGGGGRVAS